ncbi:MAG: coenzyme F420-0:L-glutamate ligase [Candidatus Kaiserbacteria bacterium]|nr:coenzyme F420-0:L-glutamate ligase [Candidatus Kaiserbacteria bacterium]
MNVSAIRTRVFKEKEDLIAFITAHVPKLRDGAVLAVTSKIVALSEGRTIVPKNKKAKEKIIRAESEWAVESYPGWWLTIKDGTFVINAGVDDSNADGKMVLLPRNSYRSAEKIRTELRKIYRIKKLGVLITDSRVAPLRKGVFGMALGYAGFKGLRDYRGKPDIFGRALKVTQVGVADSLAAAAALMMGEGKEQQPLAVIKDARVEFCDKINKSELLVNPEEDIFRPLFIKSKLGERRKSH